MELAALAEKLKKSPPKRVAVAAAHGGETLKAVAEAHKLGIAFPVLCGDIEKIDEIARGQNLDISPFEIIETDSDTQSAAVAVSLVKSGRADILMKGHLHTADLMRAVLNRENGLRAGGTLSHVAVMYSPGQNKTWILTDGAMVMYPDLEKKAQLIRNAVAAANSLGIENPKVAPIAGVETVNPNMQATLDAAALCEMNMRGQIQNCVVDGPLAFDLAVSPDAAKRKGVSSPAAGCADILLFHNIEAGNSTGKAMTHIGGCVMGGVIMGALAPVALVSRSDSFVSKLYSIAVAAAVK